jgi:hypothetical protein
MDVPGKSRVDDELDSLQSEREYQRSKPNHSADRKVDAERADYSLLTVPLISLVTQMLAPSKATP